MHTQTQPTERPILFSSPMVQAILAGRKTETRRVVKPKPPGTYIGLGINEKKNIVGHYWSNGLTQRFWPALGKPLKCPYGQPGDVLWVRETFRKFYGDSEYPDCYVYKADIDKCGQVPVKHANGKGVGFFTWDKAPAKPSIHMPKAAARIWLQVTEIKVERLHDITEQGAIAEGVEPYKTTDKYKDYYLAEHVCNTAKQSFITLWHSINGKDSLAANPWVWVVKFKVLSTTGKPQNL